MSLYGDFSAFARPLVPNERIMRILSLKLDESSSSNKLNTMQE